MPTVPTPLVTSPALVSLDSLVMEPCVWVSETLACLFLCLWLTSLDIDECDLDIDNCHPNATCTDSNGGFECSCNPGFTGSGTDCAGKILVVTRTVMTYAPSFLH